MKQDSLEQLFKRLEHKFDTENPSENHEALFLEKLQRINTPAPKQETTVRKLKWLKPMLIAASVVLIFGIFFTNNLPTQNIDLADVSPEMEQTQAFFTQAIERELFAIKEQATPETKEIVDNALTQINKLEAHYTSLQSDLMESGQDKRVIYAMIENFQNRIDLLEQVLEQIEAIKKLNDLRPKQL